MNAVNESRHETFTNDYCFYLSNDSFISLERNSLFTKLYLSLFGIEKERNSLHEINTTLPKIKSFSFFSLSLMSSKLNCKKHFIV